MIILFLAPATNYHTQKWCKWFYNSGHDVHLISFVKGEIENIKVHCLDSGAQSGDSDIKKLSYCFLINKVRKLIKEIKPDIINAHYASSYGFIAALSCPKKYVLSLWGSDIFDFPRKSIAHRYLIKYVLLKAKTIYSTSKAMAIEASKYTSRNIDITPFGVDMTLFSPQNNKKKTEEYIIGNIKTLSDKYGIADTIRAFALACKKRPDLNIYLKIGGKGPQEDEYLELAKHLKIDQKIIWLGFLDQKSVSSHWNTMDIAVIYSEAESFGVSAVEANACGVPVIISDIPGLMESTCPNLTSIVVKRKDPERLADAIIELLENKSKRATMAKNARIFAESHYELNKCFRHIESLFFRDQY